MSSLLLKLCYSRLSSLSVERVLGLTDFSPITREGYFLQLHSLLIHGVTWLRILIVGLKLLGGKFRSPRLGLGLLGFCDCNLESLLLSNSECHVGTQSTTSCNSITRDGRYGTR